MSDLYYKLLNIPSTASIDDIKKAYRAKAKLLHPDKNKSENAQQEFIELTEAYEYLIAQKNGRFRQYVSPFEKAEQAEKLRREEATRKARAYAQMRYEEFEKSQAARTINSLNNLLDIFLVLFLFVVYLGICIIITYYFSLNGFILSVLFLLATGKYFWQFINPYLKLSDWWISLNTLVETLFFRIVVLTVANLYLLFKVVSNTVIPTWFVPVLFIIIPFIVYSLLLRKKNTNTRLWYSIVILPLTFNALFALNFYFSSNPMIEEYDFIHGYNESRGKKVMNTMIYLEGNTYDEYLGLRVFPDLTNLANSNHIIYQLEDGLLGIRVVKHYEFTYE